MIVIDPAVLDSLIVDLEAAAVRTDDGRLPERNPFFEFPTFGPPGRRRPVGMGPVYTDRMKAFWTWCATNGLAQDDTDYPQWMKPFAVSPYVWIEQATVEQIDRFLFAIQRQERFCDGLWAGMIVDGTFRRLLARYRTLISDDA